MNATKRLPGQYIPPNSYRARRRTERQILRDAGIEERASLAQAAAVERALKAGLGLWSMRESKKPKPTFSLTAAADAVKPAWTCCNECRHRRGTAYGNRGRRLCPACSADYDKHKTPGQDMTPASRPARPRQPNARVIYLDDGKGPAQSSTSEGSGGRGTPGSIKWNDGNNGKWDNAVRTFEDHRYDGEGAAR